jgi:hypothetical protein
VRGVIEAHARERREALCGYVAGLVRDREVKGRRSAEDVLEMKEKEAELDSIETEVKDMLRQLAEKESAVRDAATALERSERERALPAAHRGRERQGRRRSARRGRGSTSQQRTAEGPGEQGEGDSSSCGAPTPPIRAAFALLRLRDPAREQADRLDRIRCSPTWPRGWAC